MDHAWWVEYIDEVRETFCGARFSVNDEEKRLGVQTIPKPFTAFGNSGAGAINFAAHSGATRILLLGYDCEHTNGKKHWHGDHPRQLGNANMIHKWGIHFDRLKESLPANVEIINCSRHTALKHFERQSLEEALSSGSGGLINRIMAMC